jgi:HSP20 family protein
MREQTTGLRPASRERELVPLKLTSFDEIFKDMTETFDAIARRAYEIFETNGRQFGRDIEDWFRAERELLHPIHLEVRESDGAVTVRAEVPGFEAKDLEIGVEGRQLTIAGKRETSKEEEKEKVLYSERRSNQIYRCVELPAEVDSEKATATLKGGVLEMTMPKAAPARRIRIEPKAA